MQNCKIQLLKRGLLKGLQKKAFATKEAFAYSTSTERAAFATLQHNLSLQQILVYFDQEQKLYTDLDVVKEHRIGAIVYYVKNN